MITNMPQWVVQVAEKWGLYWGGYGWSSGCSVARHVNARRCRRDPMHFEFNGTPAQARRSCATTSAPVAVSTSSTRPATSPSGACCATETPGGGTRIAVDTNAPGGRHRSAREHRHHRRRSPTVTSLPRTARRGRPGCASGRTATSAPGARRRRRRSCRSMPRAGSASTSRAAFHTVVDVQGYFAPSAAAPNGNLYTPVTAGAIARHPQPAVLHARRRRARHRPGPGRHRGDERHADRAQHRSPHSPTSPPSTRASPGT